jgi:ABC-2 type transport system permease protein
MFFQFSVLDSAQSVLGSIQLVKKIYFPREVLPLAAVASNFIHLLLGYVVFFLFLLTVYLRDRTVIPFQITTLFLPLLLLINLMLAVGVSLIVSALNTLYEDVKYIVGVLMYLLFFLCPIMYFAEEVANSRSNIQSHYLIYKLYNLNPIAVLTTAYRKILLAPIKVPIRNPDGKPLVADTLPMAWDYVAYSFVLSFLIMVGGYALFNRMKWRFVERP